MSVDRAAALRRERDQWLQFCATLTPEEWQRDSAAAGWRVRDVVAHLGSISKAMFTPAALGLLTGSDIERANDALVDRRRDWPVEKVWGEYRTWSGRLGGLAALVLRTPAAAVPIPLSELGRFPVRLVMGAALLFDHHVHLRYDVAPALGRPAPPSDPERLGVVLEWMLAVLGNQLAAAGPAWLDRPVALELRGEGGGTWVVHPDRSVVAGPGEGAAARVVGVAAEFPEWGTTRAPWRERNVTLAGDEELGARFLDALNVV